MRYVIYRVSQKPLSFFLGWFVIGIMVVNNQFFQGRFLYSEKLSFLTQDVTGVLFFIFWLLSAVEIIRFDVKKSK